MLRARTALGQNGRATLWNDEGTDSCAGQNGQHAQTRGPIYIKTTHLPIAYHGFCDTHDPILPKVIVRSQTHDSVCARERAPIFLESLNV